MQRNDENDEERIQNLIAEATRQITHGIQATDQIISAGDPENELIDNIRTILITHCSKNAKEFLPAALLQSAYDKAIELANFSPINAKDPITQADIEPEDKVVVSSGHQFDINSLIAYHNNRQYRDTEFDEYADAKWLLNPFTNAKFSDLDAQHIQQVAEEKGVEIKYLLVVKQDDEIRNTIADIENKQARLEAILNEIDKENPDSALVAEFRTIFFPYVRAINSLEHEPSDAYATLGAQMHTIYIAAFDIPRLHAELEREETPAERTARYDAEGLALGIIPDDFEAVQHVAASDSEPENGNSNGVNMFEPVYENEVEGLLIPQEIREEIEGFSYDLGTILYNTRNDLDHMTNYLDVVNRIAQGTGLAANYMNDGILHASPLSRRFIERVCDIIDIDLVKIDGFYKALHQNLFVEESELNRNPRYNESTPPYVLERAMQLRISTVEGYIQRAHTLMRSENPTNSLNEISICIREAVKVRHYVVDINRLMPNRVEGALQAERLNILLQRIENRFHALSEQTHANRPQSSTTSLFQNLNVQAPSSIDDIIPPLPAELRGGEESRVARAYNSQLVSSINEYITTVGIMLRTGEKPYEELKRKLDSCDAMLNGAEDENRAFVSIMRPIVENYRAVLELRSRSGADESNPQPPTSPRNRR